MSREATKMVDHKESVDKVYNQAQQTAPFTCNILVNDDTLPKQRPSLEDLSKEMAASYRIGDDLIAPTRLEERFVWQEFQLDRLHNVMQHLWMAGRPVPPRPIHHQILLDRDIVITERMDMHLLWGRGHLFLKPIPRFLLIPEFWATSMMSDPGDIAKDVLRGFRQHRNLRECALGFLVSYIALIARESDFDIAKERRLIPREVTWQNWRLLVRQILTSSNSLQSQVADRFIYGELRLSRLNLIYSFLGSPITAYLPRWSSYASFYGDNLQIIVAATAYVVVILTAMQVGLATTRLSQNDTFQSVSYGLTVFSILGPLAAVVVVFVIFLVVFGINYVRALDTERKRQKTLGRSWSTQSAEMRDTGGQSSSNPVAHV